MEESAQIAHENLPSTALRYVKHSRNFSTKIVVEHDDNTMKTDKTANSDNKSYTTMKMAKGKRNTVILRFSPRFFLSWTTTAWFLPNCYKKSRLRFLYNSLKAFKTRIKFIYSK